jgi:hypothetical protein
MAIQPDRAPKKAAERSGQAERSGKGVQGSLPTTAIQLARTPKKNQAERSGQAER